MIRKFTLLLAVIGALFVSLSAQRGLVDQAYYKTVGVNNTVRGGTVLQDSTIVIVGSFTNVHGTLINRIARLNKDGSLFTGFNPGNGFDNTVNVVLMQPNGKLIVAGDFETFNGDSVHRIVRINQDGTRDYSFTPGMGFDLVVYCLCLDTTSGKIYVGGDFFTYDGFDRNCIVRINSDGSCDQTFSTGTGADNSVFAIERQPSNGKIIISGNFGDYNTNTVSRMARINTDGSFDNSFNIGTGVSGGAVLTSTLLADGRIVIGGLFNGFNGNTVGKIARVNSDGSFDATFNPGSGIANQQITEFAQQANGKIIAVGNFANFNGLPVKHIVRLDTSGARDLTYGVGMNGYNLSLNTVFLDKDGKAVTGGTFTLLDSFARIRLARHNTDGSVDHTFMLNSGIADTVNAVGIQSDGKAIVLTAGSYRDDVLNNSICRFNYDGTYDNTFNSGTGFSGGASNDIAILSNDKMIIVGGFTSYNGTTVGKIVKLNADGTIDTSFHSGTGVTGASVINMVTVLRSGKILIGGNFTSYNGVTINRLARLHADGTLDGTFTSGTGPNNQIYAITELKSDSLMIGGTFTQYNGTAKARFARLTPDGVLDGSFVIGTGANAQVSTIAEQSNGKYLIGGKFATINGTARQQIARINYDGSLDITYDPIVNAPVYKIQIMPGDSALVGGAFSSVNGVAQKGRLVWLTPSGNIDSVGFYSNRPFDNIVRDFEVNANTRKIFVGGLFNFCQNICDNYLARLENSAFYQLTVPSPICAGNQYNATFYLGSNFLNGNVFTLQMSDSSGSFANAVNVGSITSFTSGYVSIPFAISSSLALSDLYRFRVIASMPADTSGVSQSVSVYSTSTPPTITPGSATTFCEGGSVILTSSSVSQNLWSNGDTTQSISVTTSGHFTVSLASGGCSAASDTTTVTVNAKPDSVITANGSTTFCQGSSVTLTAASGFNYTWNNSATSSSVTVTSAGNYSVTLTDAATSCTAASNVVSVTVNSLPVVNVDSVTDAGSAVLCAVTDVGATIVKLTGTPTGGTFSGSSYISNDTLYAGAALSAGEDSIIIHYSYTNINNCTATDSTLQVLVSCLGLEELNVNAVSVLPNPSSGIYFVEMKNSFSKETSLRITDIAGKIVLEKILGEKIQHTVLDISYLASGVYFLRISDAEKFILKKLVKE